MVDRNDNAPDGSLEIVSDAAEAGVERITLRAEISTADGRSLDPKRHDSEAARAIATELCEALTEAYAAQDAARPETLAIAVQTVLETLLSGIEKEGVDTTTMRVALANSVLSNGRATVSIDVAAEPQKTESRKPEPERQPEHEPERSPLLDMAPGVTIH
jgi:hypothetical protein